MGGLNGIYQEGYPYTQYRFDRSRPARISELVCWQGNAPEALGSGLHKEGGPAMPKTVLRIVCMFCGIVMGTKDGKGVQGDSGSICEKCWYKEYPDYGPYPEEENDGAIWY